MDSEIFSCPKCSLKSLFLKDQLCGHIFCQRCGAKTDITAQRTRKETTEVVDAHVEEFCIHCNFGFAPDKIESHYETCEMHPVKCNFCNEKFVRRTIKLHAQECLLNLRQCKFSHLGCQFQGSQTELQQHENDNVHVELMMHLLLTLQIEQSSNASMLARSFNELMSLKEVVNGTQSKVNDMVEQNAGAGFGAGVVANSNIEDVINRLKMELIANKQEILDLELKQNKKIEEVMSSNMKLEVQNSQLEQSYGSLIKQQTEQSEKVQNYQQTLKTVISSNSEEKKKLTYKLDGVVGKQTDFNDDYSRLKNKVEKVFQNLKELKAKVTSFPYIWKIEKFAECQNNAKSPLSHQTDIFSDPFYTNMFGYKMRLQLYPNGVGDGKGSHLSIFLQVMKGDNDAILTWPVHYTAELSVMDQSKHKDHHSQQLKSDFVKCKGFDKPVTDHNLGFGFHTFISIERLKPLYLVDDIIYFKLDITITS